MNNPLNKFDPDGFEEHSFFKTLLSAVSIHFGAGFGYAISVHAGPIHFDGEVTLQDVHTISANGSTGAFVLDIQATASRGGIGRGWDFSNTVAVTRNGQTVLFKKLEIESKATGVGTGEVETKSDKPSEIDVSGGTKETEIGGEYGEGIVASFGITIDNEKSQEAFLGLFKDAQELLTHTDLQDAKQMNYLINTPQDQLGNQPVSQPCQAGGQACDRGNDNDHLDFSR